MTQIVSLAIECDIGIILVCHTSAPRSLRGSKGIEKLADAVIFLERDKLNDDPVIANTTQVIVNKNRWCGEVGTACYLHYDPDTGRMLECAAPVDDGGEAEF
jgi:twinkle protein